MWGDTPLLEVKARTAVSVGDAKSSSPGTMMRGCG